MTDVLASVILLVLIASLMAPLTADFLAHVSRYRVRRREFGADGLSWGEVWKDTR